MKRSIVNLLVVLALSVLATSCHRKSFDETKVTFRSFFENTTYSEIQDEDIISETVVESFEHGDIVDVEYKYGATIKHKAYYRDIKGKTVMIHNTAYRCDNGYPSTRSFAYRINNDGYVAFDFFSYMFILIFGFSLAGCFIIRNFMC